LDQTGTEIGLNKQKTKDPYPTKSWQHINSKVKKEKKNKSLFYHTPAVIKNLILIF
jgi:hypothetical protein